MHPSSEAAGQRPDNVVKHMEEIFDFRRELEEIKGRERGKSVIRQSMIGVVSSARKMQKSVTVTIYRNRFYTKYQSYFRVRKKYIVHDEYDQTEVGDLVRIVQCRPLSLKKRHTVHEIIRKNYKDLGLF